MKTTLTAALTPLLFAGSAFAADGVGANGFMIESEAQFVRDYGGQIEQVGPGVYQVVSGDLAGKTVAIGEAGLEYDLNAQRALGASISKSSSGKAESDALILKLEEQLAHYVQMRTQASSDANNDKRAVTIITCLYWPFNANSPIWYGGYAEVSATTEFYIDRGDGTLNWYYARAGASANGFVSKPYNVPAFFSLSADAYVRNAYNGQSISNHFTGLTSASTGAGYIYSGPSFAHNMDAYAAVGGIGDCFGYVSVSDSMRPYY